MKFSMKFEGGKELAATLRAMPKSQSRAAQYDALEAAAEPIVASARSKAPRAPGYPDLADNIDLFRTRKRKDVSDTETGVVIGPWKKRFYGFFLEWGTVKMQAQPFLRPAFDENTKRSLGILETQLWANVTSWLMKRNVR